MNQSREADDTLPLNCPKCGRRMVAAEGSRGPHDVRVLVSCPRGVPLRSQHSTDAGAGAKSAEVMIGWLLMLTIVPMLWSTYYGSQRPMGDLELRLRHPLRTARRAFKG